MGAKSIDYEKIVLEILNGFYNDDYIVIEDKTVKVLFDDFTNAKWIYVPDFIKQCVKVMSDEKTDFSVISMANLKEFIKDSSMGVNLGSIAVRFAEVYRCKSKKATKRGDKLKATKLSKFWLDVVRECNLELHPEVFATLCSLDINLAFDKRFCLCQKRDYSFLLGELKHKGIEKELGMYLIKNGYALDLSISLRWLWFMIEDDENELNEEFRRAFLHALFAYISFENKSFDIALIADVKYFIQRMKPAEAIIIFSRVLQSIPNSRIVKAKDLFNEEFNFVYSLLQKTRSVEARVMLAKALRGIDCSVFPVVYKLGKEIVNVKFHNDKELHAIHCFIAYSFIGGSYENCRNKLREILSKHNF